MPIANLVRQSSFPQIGELRKGAPKPADGRSPGRDLTYLRFTSEIPEVLHDFRAAYGEQPAQLLVYLPHITVEENWSAWREEWVAGGLVHRCNGISCVAWRDPDTQKIVTEAKNMPCPGGCNPIGRLRVLLPDLGRLAYVLLQTGSLHDIANLESQLNALYSIPRKDDGHSLQGIPMILARRPKTISVPMVDKRTGEMKRGRRQVSLLSIEASPDWTELQIRALAAAARPDVPLLEAPAVTVQSHTYDNHDIPTPPPPEEPDEEEDGEWTSDPEMSGSTAAPGSLVGGDGADRQAAQDGDSPPPGLTSPSTTTGARPDQRRQILKLQWQLRRVLTPDRIFNQTSEHDADLVISELKSLLKAPA